MRLGVADVLQRRLEIVHECAARLPPMIMERPSIEALLDPVAQNEFEHRSPRGSVLPLEILDQRPLLIIGQLRAVDRASMSLVAISGQTRIEHELGSVVRSPVRAHVASSPQNGTEFVDKSHVLLIVN